MDYNFRDEIKELMQRHDDHCISIYIPTHRAGRETEQDPIRLDNLLRRAEKELSGRGMRPADARELLEPARNLARDGFFVRRLADGLGIFLSPGFFKHYRTPIHFDELLAVGKRFMLKPLVPMLNSDNPFYVLAVSRKSVRLLHCTEFGASEVELENVPKSMSEALGYEETEDNHSFRATPQLSAQRGVAMIYGRGGGVEMNKEYIRNYFLALKDSLRPYLGDERTPLVFAGVEYLFPIFKSVNAYPNVLPQAVEGNPDDLDSPQLHRQGLRIALPYLRKAEQEAVRRLSDMSCNGNCSDKLEKILRGAFEGRVDTLLVDIAATEWGSFDPLSGSVEVHRQQAPGDDDLIDLAAVETFLNGGAVYPLAPGRMPGRSEISAIFRY